MLKENKSFNTADYGSVKTLNKERKEVFTLPENLKIDNTTLRQIIETTKKDLETINNTIKDYKKIIDGLQYEVIQIKNNQEEILNRLSTLESFTTGD